MKFFALFCNVNQKLIETTVLVLSQVSGQKSIEGMFASAQPPSSAGVYCRGTPGTEAGRPYAYLVLLQSQ